MKEKPQTLREQLKKIREENPELYKILGEGFD